MILSSLYILLCYCCFGQTGSLELWQIQGDQLNSPYEGQYITTENNIVTAIGFDRFFIQTPASRTDNDPATSDAIMVYTGFKPTIQTGNIVTLSGYVKEYRGSTEFGDTDLIISLSNQTASLPEALNLPPNFPSTLPKDIPDLESVEHMLVNVSNAIVTGPTYSGTTPLTLQNERPFREAGIKYPGIGGLPLWDGNPEVFEMNINVLPTNIVTPLSSRMKVTGMGVIIQDNDRYQLLPIEYKFLGNRVEQAVRLKEAKEVTVGSLNTFVFNKQEPDYQIRLKKIAKYIVELMHSPDILALQEVGSLSVLNDLAAEVQQLGGVSYQSYLFGGSSNFPIFTGYLVSDAVQNVQVSQLGESQQLSLGGKLHDRPPLLLEAEFRTPDPTPIKVLNLHLRSLNGIEGSNSFYVRTKRHEQAVSVARMVQSMQGKNLILVGDFNAYEFSDGYVDVLNEISGHPSLGALFEPIPIVNPPLIHHSALVNQAERYSYVFDGNAQLIDHCLSTELKDIKLNGLQYVRANSDNPDIFYTDASSPMKASDHDGLVLFLELEDSLQTMVEIPSLAAAQLLHPNPFPEGASIRIGLPESAAVQWRLITLDGKLVAGQQLGDLGAGWHSELLHNGLAAGMYILEVEIGDITFRRKLLMGI